MKPKASNQIISPTDFVRQFGPALQEYLEYQYNKEGHILDLLAASGEFFSVSYHSVGASIELLGYTHPVTTSPRK